TLIFSYVGYKTVEVPIKERAEINLELMSDAKELEQLVVIGYGTQRRKDLTGSIASISSEDIEAIPTASIDQILQGRAAGMNISQLSGAPGGRTSIRIRGASSINAGN